MRVIAFVCIGILALIGFVIVELRTRRPLLDVRLFKDWSYTSGSIVTWTVQMSLFGSLFLLPIYLQNLRGLNAFQAGLWLLPSALITLIFQPIGGILVDRIGAKWIILVGTVALVITTFSLSRLNLFTGFWSFQMILVVRNIALSFTLQPSNVVALYNVPRQLLPRATSLYNVMRQLMVSFGTALLATFVQNREPVHYTRLAEQITAFSPAASFVAGLAQAFQAQGYDPTNAHLAALQVLSLQLRGQATMNAFNDAFLLTVGIAILGVIAAFLLPSPARMRRSQEYVQGVPVQAEATRGSRAAALIE
ncbi:MAG TPA: MFS transporter [Ktedonobacteraceae bacterium]|nr:MFS transporter [Ktedonobacteraceae bacterium]